MNTKIQDLNLSETRHRIALSILLLLYKSQKDNSKATIDFVHHQINTKVMAMLGQMILRSELIELLRLAEIRIYHSETYGVTRTTLGIDDFSIDELRRRLSRKKISKNLDKAAELLTEKVGIE